MSSGSELVTGVKGHAEVDVLESDLGVLWSDLRQLIYRSESDFSSITVNNVTKQLHRNPQ